MDAMIRAIMLSFNEGGQFMRVLCRWLLQTYILFKANNLLRQLMMSVCGGVVYYVYCTLIV